MGESCFIIPTCKNKEGKDVESKLFEDLWKISGNYEWAEKQYKIATDQEFLESVSEDAVFDKNGQISARSFLDITGITYESDEIKERLSKKWGDSNLPTEEVSARVSDFNAQEELKDDFVPVIDEQEGEVVKFTIAKRSPERVSELQSFIENNELLKAISQRLKDLGVAYDFVGKRDRYSGRFSTRNAQQAFDGLYHLIEIADGGNVEEVLIEESAHLATLACKDSRFINRLLDAINERTVSKLFSAEELKGVDLNSKDAKLELAGKLVAKALKNEKTEYNGLLGNIKRMIYKIFSGSNLSSLLSARTRARLMAERLAHGFLYDENFDVNTALDTSVDLFFSKPITEEGKTLKEGINSIIKLGAKVKTFSQVAYNQVYKAVSEKEILKDKDYSTLEETEAVGLMGGALDTLIERLNSLSSSLQIVTKENIEDHVKTDDINTAYEIDSILEAMASIAVTYDSLRLGAGTLDPQTLSSIEELLNKIKTSIAATQKSLDNYKFLYSAQLMKEFLGKDNVELAADVQTKYFWSKARARDKRDYSVEQLVSYYYDEIADNNPVISFLRTYSNHRDITTQAFYNIIRRAKAQEAILYNDKVDELIQIEKDWKEFIRKNRQAFDGNTSLYERLDDGSLSGYFRGEVKYGQLYRDRADIIRKVKEEFLGYLRGSGIEAPDGSIFNLRDYKRLTKGQKQALFQDFLENHSGYNNFLKSIYEDEENKIFASKYIDNDFIELCNKFPEFKKLYERITAFKKSIDVSFLTDATDTDGGKCHGVFARLPQFKASIVDRIFKNRGLITNRDLYDSRNLKEICEDVTSDYFGSPLTEAVAFDSEDTESYPDVRRLALYGINTLDKPNEISTDIFKSLELYTEMACRFHTSQAVASRLELFHSQLNKRQVTSSITDRWLGKRRGASVESTSTKTRETILSRFVYDTKKYSVKDKKFWIALLERLGLKAVGILAAFGAIRALCISPIAGLKNFIAGYRVFLQDVSAGIVEGVTVKDVIKSTLNNLNPAHVVGEVGRVLYGNTMTIDKYQKLLDRWDSYRTPTKIHRKRGFHPLQSLVNVMMANYSLTDNALIGIIYYSRLDKVKLYDAENLSASGRPTKIKASNGYKWSSNNTPQLKEGLLLDINDFDKYKAIKGIRNIVEAVIENNDKEGEGVELISLSDYSDDIESFITAYPEFSKIKGSDGMYKTPEEILKILSDTMRKMCFSEEQEFDICNNINDYIISSQGVYGLLNATEFQSDVYTQSLGKIKGYMFGLLQRNYFTNYRASNGKVNHGIVDTLRLALWSTFSGAKELAAAGDITPTQYRLYTAMLCFLPPALRSKSCVKHLRDCGWDPDQLEKLTCACIGFWIQFLLSRLCNALYRGNERSIGNKVYEGKGKVPLKNAKLNGAITMYTEGRYNKLIKPGILFPESGKSIDYEKVVSQRENWMKEGREPMYPKNMRDPSEGGFIPGTKAFEDRYQSYVLKNIIYNSDDPLYYITGACYRLSRGIRDEGLTLGDPLRFANDFAEMLSFKNSIVFSSGLNTLANGVEAVIGNDAQKEKWWAKSAKFYLNKIGYTYDSTPEIGKSKVQPLDWYDKQDTIDRFQEQTHIFPQIIQ